MRAINLNTINIGGRSATMESITDSWGEDDQIVSSAIGGEFDEHLSLALWCKLARQSVAGEVFLDIGAYSGIYALAAAIHSTDLRIMAFEPSTITFSRLTKNVLLNGFDLRILPVNLGAGDAVIRTEFPHRFGLYSLCSGESGYTEEPDHTQPVMIVPVDTLLEGSSQLPYINSRSISIFPFSRVAAMKVDVEGAELEVLRGARGIIERDKPVIIAEALSEDFANKINVLVGGMGYKSIAVPNERNLVLFPKGGPAPKLNAPDLKPDGFVTGVRLLTHLIE